MTQWFKHSNDGWWVVSKGKVFRVYSDGLTHPTNHDPEVPAAYGTPCPKPDVKINLFVGSSFSN